MANSSPTLERGQLGLFGVIMRGDLRPGQPSPFNALPWLTLCLIAVGVVYALVLSIARPAVLARAPALLEGEESLEVDPMPAG